MSKPSLFLWIFSAAAVSLSVLPLHALGTCDPRAYGAKGDGKTKDTAAIQKAIDACAQKGGGEVKLSAGAYVSAPIELKSNVTLRLEKDATLLGSPDHQDYPAREVFRLPDLQPLVTAVNAENVDRGRRDDRRKRRELVGRGEEHQRSWHLGHGASAAKVDSLRLLQACARGGNHGAELADVAGGSVLLRRRDNSQYSGACACALAEYGCDRSVFIFQCRHRSCLRRCRRRQRGHQIRADQFDRAGFA